MNAPFSSKLPDEVIVIADNLNAQAFLLAEGILDQLPNRRSLAETNEFYIKPVFYCHYAHGTHWVLAFLVCNSYGKDEKGIMVIAWPKSQFQKSVIDDEIKRLDSDAEKYGGIKRLENNYKITLS